MRGAARAYVQAVSLALAAVAIGLGVAVLLTGGFDARVLGVKVTAHDLVRPSAAAILGLVFYLSSGGRFSPASVLALPVIGPAISGCRRATRWRRLPGLTALLLAVAVAVIGVLYNSKVAGGSDSWGYLGFSEQWLRGELKVDAAFAAEVPWPDALETFSPLGYRPADDGSARIVPTYAAGFPLMLAAAKRIAGEPGKYAVLPISGAILVLATFGLGRRLGSPAAGVIAAAFVAASPTVLHAATVMLSDLPTAAAWAAALYFVLGGTARSALVAGLAAGIAVLTRPNHLPLAVVLALVYVDRARGPAARSAALRHLLLFSAGAAAGIGAAAAVNAALYGSPFLTGYRPLSVSFSLANVVPNLWRYPAWISQLETPFVLLGFVALVLPMRRLWPARGRPAEVLLLALFSAVLLSLYLVYIVFGSWEYLRFIVALWPPMMVGAAALVALLLRSPRLLLRRVAVAIVACVLGFQVMKVAEYRVFDTWESERRFVSGALMTASHTAPGSVVMSMQHSGSVRYYAGRMTLRYDLLRRDDVDDAIAWLTAHGVHVYLLAEDWELPEVRDRWAGTHALQATQVDPVAVYLPGGRLYLFDLSTPPRASYPTDYVETVERGVSIPGPVPLPPLVFHATSTAAGR
jgi:4-amino-4-deoxy-L-arabinose transferase-like glycosyltransferase